MVEDICYLQEEKAIHSYLQGVPKRSLPKQNDVTFSPSLVNWRKGKTSPNLSEVGNAEAQFDINPRAVIEADFLINSLRSFMMVLSF